MSEQQDQQRSYTVPGTAWAVFLSLIGLYEWWAIQSHNYTLSAWVWKQNATFPWFKYLVLGGVSFLMYHFFWQKH